MERKYNGKEFAEKVGKAILERTGKSKRELLNELFYCITEADVKEERWYSGTFCFISKERRKDYEGVIQKDFPGIYPFGQSYAYERSFRKLMHDMYTYKKAQKGVLKFTDNDEEIFDEIVEYLVVYEIAAEISDNYFHGRRNGLDNFEEERVKELIDEMIRQKRRKSVIKKLQDEYEQKKISLAEEIARDIKEHCSINMTRFCHVCTEPDEYTKLKEMDEVVTYFADLVIKIAEENTMLCVIGKKYLEKKLTA